MTLGQLIQRQRKALNLTLDDVCETAGISKGYLSDVENDRHPNVSLRVAVKLSVVLNLPINTIAATVVA